MTETTASETTQSTKSPETTPPWTEPVVTEPPYALMLPKPMADAMAVGEYETPCIVPTLYETPDVIIADVIATNKAFGADPTGEKDSTEAIQKALDYCFETGGGTVWLPAGKYLVTGSITVPSYVTLRGDWQDPDEGNEYGTIILACPPSTEDELPALFNLGGSAGVMGLTIYYPEQDINKVKPYPYTFYVSGQVYGGYMLQSIVNCTVINGYRGIGACVTGNEVHEMMTIDNVKGTFLHRGAVAYNQADVGTWKTLTISNRYWAEAGAGLKPADRAKLDAYTRKNTVGLVLGDLEWTQFANLRIDGCHIGIQIVQGFRIDFAGALFDVHITNCDVGLQVDNIDTRWGMVVAKGTIEGSEYAIWNKTIGAIKLTDVTVAGKIKSSMGDVMVDTDSLANVVPSYAKEPVKPASKLFVVKADRTGSEDITAALQSAINAAGASGGGIVYLPAGTYKMLGRVTVPAGVELRGCSSVAQRETLNKGTVILTEIPASTAPDTEPAMITLEGENAGIRGLRIFATNNHFLKGVFETGYAVRGCAPGVYIINSSITAVYNGVDFRDCDGHIIRKLVGCAYNNMITAGGKGGHIEGCLQNGTAIYRNDVGLPEWAGLEESKIWDNLFNPITRRYAEYIRLKNAENQTVLNCFAYGPKTLIVTKDSTGVKIVNVGGDNIGSKAPLISTAGGDVVGVNVMRYNGVSYQNNGAKLVLYNRLTINEKRETTVKE